MADLTPEVLGQELPALIDEGYTSFKIYMTYDDLKLSDRQILDVLSVSRREGAMAMVHAENTDCTEWLTEWLIHAGDTLEATRAHTQANLSAYHDRCHRGLA